MMQEEQQGRRLDHHEFQFFECEVNKNRWEPYGEAQQRQLRDVLQTCVTPTTTMLHYGPGKDYCVRLFKHPDGRVEGSQLNTHTGTTRQLRVFLGHGGARKGAHTDWQG